LLHSEENEPVAEYTTLDEIDLPSVARAYRLDRPRLSPLKGGAANSSFRLSDEHGDFVLTILDNHDEISAERLAEHTRALFVLGVPTTEVIPTVDGGLVADMRGRPLIVKRWVEGEVKDPLPHSLLPEAGRILARFHALPSEAPGLEDVPVGTRRLSRDHVAAITDFPDTGFAAWLTDRLARIRVAEENNKRRSTVVHGDLFADNIIVCPNEQLTVLDWETISLDDPLLDLGMAAVGLAEVDRALVPNRLKALVSGYQEITPLADRDLAALPLEIEHAALIIAFHRYYRHNIRFRDPAKSDLYTGMIEFVESVQKAPELPAQATRSPLTAASATG